jgi:hypothetical protein
MFNLLDTTEGDKVDFWLLTDDAFDASRFARKYEEDIFGFKMNVSAAEDTILSKPKWAKLSGGSEKQFKMHYVFMNYNIVCLIKIISKPGHAN